MMLAKYIILLSIIFTSSLFSYEPSEHVDKDTFIYMELSPLNYSVAKTRKLFYSLMDRENADSEWQSMQDIFLEEYGINFLSPDDVKSHGFDIHSPLGAFINYTTIPAKNTVVYKKYFCALLPSLDPAVSYEFLLEWFRKSATSPSMSDPGQLQFREIEKGKIFGLFSQSENPDNIFVLKTDGAILISDNLAFLKKPEINVSNALSRDKDFINTQKYYKKNSSHQDSIGYFFINSKKQDVRIKNNPKLLLDNILLDNVFIKELSGKSNCIAGEIKINDRTLKLNMDYFFPDNYLSQRESLLADALNFQKQTFFPDYMQSAPFVYIKMQSAFSDAVIKRQRLGMPAQRTLQMLFQKLTNGIAMEIPENLELLPKDNISFYIKDIPAFRELNKLYKWKYYISFSYNSAYFKSFSDFMNNLEKKSLELNDLKIESSETKGKYFWKMIVTDYNKKFDRKLRQVIIQENRYNVYMLAQDSQIIITDDEKINTGIPGKSGTPLYEKLDPERSEKKEILFSYFNIKKLLLYFEQNTFAFPVKNFLGYLENAENAVFKVTSDKNIISKEFILKIAR